MTDTSHTLEAEESKPRFWCDKPLSVSRVHWALEVGLNVATAALCLVEQRRLSRSQRGWYRAALATTTAGLAALGVARDRGWWESGDAGWFSGTLATVLAVAGPLERLDARIAGALEARGVKHLRRWQAGATLAEAVVSGIRSFPRRRVPEQAAEATEPRPLSPEVRALVERILGAIDDHGAKELRAQLDGAQEVRCEHGCSTDFVVAPDAPRAKVSNYDFPVALLGDDEGAPVLAVLRVTKGCLGELEVLREGLAWEEGLERIQALELEPTDWF
ncbi:hypothetical protein EII34_11465 [Arachnia propionica]|uniref:Uncharacterized protein n=1 Tax=Arachnia propionica TaxID=1750 RepID=A0A3P1T3F6_9ACTN|nr:hypothetical protein [Arachnia propionica]MDO5082425.1 hypothetical protein [Arachnia propionica]RRD04001.1 hypothetical protein EII34_11465 [Arachnia propionica]